ncbi:hypothetical protein CAPTEDRAFT_201007 [Capitella teleta]|uniref:UBZ1-type domain-containing protein n=1 Tax=Capitella teleta TaxID=283909 RepID=R7UIB0_CAPTE|nr:hypothetical protein CAPTEDRAFT_201007 [Capitella teleta]|eukprot:ELU03518.1 hypothetical protein CAPTEDRAFT_201007 [Capitella teleta]
MDLSSSLQKSDYAQVIFDGTPEVYPTGCDILCCYTVTPLLVPDKRDWLGLYRVGWRSAKDYVNFLPAPVSSEAQKELHHEVSFKAGDLPDDDGEFYQFCYVTANGLVRGASTPFQFKSSYHDEFVEVEEEDGELLVVRTKSAVLQEKLNDAALKHSALIKDVENLEKERNGLVSKLVIMSEQLKKEGVEKQTLNTKVKEYQEKVNMYTTEATDMQQVHDNLREKISVLNQEKECMEKRLDDNDVYLRSLQDKIKTLINEKDSLMGMSKVLEEEKELFKDHFTSSESTIKCYLQESEKLKEQLKEAQLQCSQLRTQTDQLTSELAMERSRTQEVEAAQREDKDRIEGLEEKVRNAEDKLKAAEHCKILLNDEVLNVQEVYKKVSADLEASKTEAFNLRSKISAIETSFNDENQKMESETHRLRHLLQDMQMEKSIVEDELSKVKSSAKHSEDKQKSENGPMFALQVAHKKLSERLQKMSERNERLTKQVEGLVAQQCAWEDRERMLDSEIRDLKNRLSMGQEEYKNQFIKSQKLQAQLNRLSRSGSLSSERSTDNPRSELEEVQTSEQFTEYEAQDKVTACTLTDATVTGSKESQTDVRPKQTTTPTEADTTEIELKQQVDKLESELQHRMTKKQKYKTLWQEEKGKNNFLKKHYYDELRKKEDEIRALIAQLDATEVASQQRIEKLEMSPVTTPPPTIFPNPYADYVPSPDEFDPLKSQGLVVPLQPLPPPLTPQMTREAKVAAIKAKQPSGVGLNGILNLRDPCQLADEKRTPKGPPPSSPGEGESNAEADNDDDHEFVDAPGEPQKHCPICSMTFPADTTDVDVSDHIDDHYGPVCPICHHQFEKGVDQEMFQVHVENHFD